MPNMNAKYRSAKTNINGIIFDSKKEARRWVELCFLQQQGLIQNLERQVKFLLIPTQYETFARFGKNGNRLKDGKRVVEHECAYYADFVYYENGERIVEDTKDVKTSDYIIKRKLMRWIHGIDIREV